MGVYSTGLPDGAGGTFLIWSDERSGSADVYAQHLSAAGEPEWTPNGVAVCTASDDQWPGALVSDGAGGVVLMWYDHRSGNYDIYAQRLDGTGTAQWATNGIPMCTAPGDQWSPSLISDDANGAIGIWVDDRSGNDDIYAQRVNALGVPQWTTDGVGLCTAAGSQANPSLVSDGAGGAIASWEDPRSGTTSHVYAQRVSATGVPQWTADGVELCTAAGSQADPSLVSDGAGGAIAAWSDYRTGAGTAIYAQRVDGSGARLWPPSGAAVCTTATDPGLPASASDGAGGAIVAWMESRSDTTGTDAYAQRIDGSGALQWAPNGVTLCAGTGIFVMNENGVLIAPSITSDGVGGAAVSWMDRRSDPPPYPYIHIYAQRVSVAGAPVWTGNGIALCDAPGDQYFPSVVSDGAGGVIATWFDERSTDSDIYAQRVDGAGTIQWTANGVGVYVDPGVQRYPAAVSDGSGGIIIAWQEKRDGNYDIYARKFDGVGAAQWPAIPVCSMPEAQVSPLLVSDGAGGAIIAWQDRRDRYWKVYAQRVTSSGALSWAAGGVLLCAPPGDRFQSFVPLNAVGDGAGGVIAIWGDSYFGIYSGGTTELHVQRVSGSGTLLWTSGGTQISSTLEGPGGPPGIIADEAGGAIVAWSDYRSGAGTAIYAQRVSAAGTPVWSDSGVPVCTESGDRGSPVIASDGAGGAIVAWEDSRGGIFSPSDIYAQRLNADGLPQWTPGGAALCTAANNQWSPAILSDGAGGAIVAWLDHRDDPGGNSNSDLYAQHVNAAGASQWTADGIALCTAPGNQMDAAILSDGAGGAIVDWVDFRGVSKESDIYAQRVDAGGVTQWASPGVVVCGAVGNQLEATSVSDDAGGAFIAWQDHRDGVQDFIDMQRLGPSGAVEWTPDGITPTQVSLVSTEAEPDRVRLTWFAADFSRMQATVYRRRQASGWIMAGTISPDGTGRLVFEDLDVLPGERYGYRLGILENGTERFVGETWVAVPLRAVLALEGFRPNPSHRDPIVSLSLPSSDPATIEVLDLAGRRILSQKIHEPRAGGLLVRLSQGEAIPPGVYLVRLRSGGHVLTKKGIVLGR